MADAVMQPIAEVPPRWSLAQRIAFRFFFCYWLLYSLPVAARLISLFPGGEFATKPYTAALEALCPWVAIHLFHVSGMAATYFPTGAGDTTLGYVEHFCYLVISFASAVVWSIADSKRPNYRRLHAWLRVMVRYTLAFIMFGYGIVKLFPMQFRYPDPSRLIEPYGDFSPMGVLWNFMGSSLVYTSLTGAIELTGATLLLFRRTTLLGAMVSAAAMLNVVLLNFCYDVPVKLYSANLLFMAIFLLAPDLGRLYGMLILHQPAPLVGSRRMRWAAIGFKVLFIGYLLFSTYAVYWQNFDRMVRNPKRSPLYGLYEVEKFVQDGQEHPPLTTDSARWRKVTISDTPGFVAILAMDDSLVRYRLAPGKDGKTLTLSDGNAPYNDSPPGVRFVFTYSRPDADHLSLQSDHLALTLRRIDANKFPLTTRTFHWINEFPFNR